MKVFSNMKRPTKGFSGQEVALFPTMLAVPAPSTSPSRFTYSLPYTFHSHLNLTHCSSPFTYTTINYSTLHLLTTPNTNNHHYHPHLLNPQLLNLTTHHHQHNWTEHQGQEVESQIKDWDERKQARVKSKKKSKKDFEKERLSLLKQSGLPNGYEHESGKQKSPKKSTEKSPEEMKSTEKMEVYDVVKEPGAKETRSSIPRKSTRRQRMEEVAEKENSKDF
ncbi:hypothetical protein Tco_1254798 [Tanacetum coccineum]